MFTDAQLKAMVVVGWENGISETGLANRLKMKLPNCITKVIKPLTDRSIFYYTEGMKTGKRGRPPHLLRLKNNPYLLGHVRNTLRERLSACDDKTEKEINKREIGFLEAVEFLKNKEHQEWIAYLNTFRLGPTYKKTEGIPDENFDFDELHVSEIGNPNYDEYLKMTSFWEAVDAQSQRNIAMWDRSKRQWEEHVAANYKTLMTLWESWEKPE